MSDRPKLVDYRNNGIKPQPTFSDAEMKRRQDAIRKLMAEHKMDAALFTSYHNICYLSDFLYCYFGRRYGLVIDHQKQQVSPRPLTAVNRHVAPSVTMSLIPIGRKQIISTPCKT